MQPEKQTTRQKQQTIEKSNQHTNLTRFDNVPTSSGQGRDLIDSTINTTITREKLEGSKGFFLRDTIHEVSSIYL